MRAAAPDSRPPDEARQQRRQNLKLTLITYSVSIIAVLAIVGALRVAAPVLVPVTFALIVSMLLRPAARWFDRRRVPETASAAFLSLLVVFAMASAIYFGARPAIAWFDRVPDIIIEAREKLEGIEQAFRRVSEVSKRVEELADGQSETEPPPIRIRGEPLAKTIADSAQTIFVQFMFTAVLIYFFLATRRSSRRKLLALRSSFRTRLRSGRIILRVETKVVGYMLTMLAINFGLGVAVGSAIALLGGPTPAAFGALAGILNFVPYLGPAILNILLAVAGLAQEESLWAALAPVGAYIALNFIESNFVTPSLIGARTRVSPLAIILSIAFFTWLWGPGGAVVAIPIVIALKTICDSVAALRPIGILLSEKVEGARARRPASPLYLAGLRAR
jgi:predicted PurR-regulated permease PerM